MAGSKVRIRGRSRNHWLVLADPRSWSRLRRSPEWRLPLRAHSRAAKVKSGDRAIVYVMKRGMVVADLQFEGGLRSGEESGADSDEFYKEFPLRVPIRYLANSPRGVRLYPIVGDLEFFGGKQHWGLSLRGVALRELPASDYALLSGKLRALPSGPLPESGRRVRTVHPSPHSQRVRY